MSKVHKGRGLGGMLVAVIVIFMLLGEGLVLLQRFAAAYEPENSETGETDLTVRPQVGQEVVATDSNTSDRYSKWAKVEINFEGPASTGLGTPNPFQIELEAIFSGPDGETFIVPGFYDGDGTGGLDGNVWRVRFSPNQVGEWSFSTTSSDELLDGHSGTFSVIPATGCQRYTPGGLPDLSCAGRLEHVGEHYLKFADGRYWLKGGADDPEDFLAPGVTVGFGSKEEAIDYLAGKSVNSLYIMLHNIDGDEENVWLWVGSTQEEAKANHERFDVAKLAQWEELFSYMQDKGLVLHIVLEDDNGWVGFNREMYYRELIARFGHHNGLYWNIGEEYNDNYTSDEIKEFAQLIRDLDPYDHPISVHHDGGFGTWDPFLGDDRFDVTSFQTRDEPQNGISAEWFEKVEDSGRTIALAFDETGKLDKDERDLTRHILWSVYMGGANFEVHTKPLDSYEDFALHFEDMTRARGLIEQLPFWQMMPMNELLTSGEGYVFAKSGTIYTVYLPVGGTIELDLSRADGDLKAQWFDPRIGSYTEPTDITGGQAQSFTAPSTDDWVLLIQRIVITHLPGIMKRL
jgi:hypothetical protein